MFIRFPKTRFATALAATWLFLSGSAFAEPELFWATDDSIRSANAGRLDLDPTVVVKEQCLNPLGLEAYSPTRSVYWVDECDSAIKRAKDDGTELEKVISFSSNVHLIDLALAEKSGWIYWIEENDLGPAKIRRVRFDGSSPQDVVTEGLDFVGGIALHEAIGKIYWLQIESTIQNAVYRANLDGTDVEKIAGIPETASFPAGIDIDRVRGVVYWTQGTKILQANLDGTNAQVAVVATFNQSESRGKVRLVTSVTVDERDGSLYWPNWVKLQDPPNDKLLISEVQIGRVPSGDNGAIIDFPRAIRHGLQVVNSIAFDPESENIYLADVRTNKISRVNISEFASITSIAATEGPLFENSSIAFDSVGRRIYWTDRVSHAVGYTDIDGAESVVLAKDDRSNVDAIALDASRGKIYWKVETFAWIKRANLDGTGEEQPISNMGIVRFFAIDEISSRLYWTSASLNTIERVNLDGSGRETVVSSRSAGRPYDLFIDAETRKIYWSDKEKDQVKRANLDGSSVEKVISLPASSDITMVAPDALAGKFYFLWNSGTKIGRANLDGSELELELGSLDSPASSLIVANIPFRPQPPTISVPREGAFFSRVGFEASGRAIPGTTVEIALDEVIVGSTIVGVDGTWRFPAIRLSSEGTIILSATTSDGDAISDRVSVTIHFDKTPPGAPTLVSALAEVGIQDLPISLSGTAEPGTTVEVFDEEALLGSVIVDEGGDWTLAVEPSLTKRKFFFRARARDRAGNVGSFSEDVVVRNLVASSITAAWNGFLDMTNVLELVNNGSVPSTTRIALLDDTGVTRGRLTVTLNSGEQRDIVVNELPGFTVNAFGLLRIFPESSSFDGRTVFYRARRGQATLEDSNDRFEFAFTVPFDSPTLGSTAVSFNTFNPNQLLGEEPKPVRNWLSIINLDETVSSPFTVLRYTGQGQEPISTRVILPPFGRRDIDGGHGSGPFQVGLNVIQPDNPRARYKSFLTRYGPGEEAPGSPALRFAVSLPARPALHGEYWVPVSNGASGENWVELVNVETRELELSVMIYENGTDGPVFEQLITVPSLGQRHINASTILSKGASGAARVAPISRGSYLAQSMFYFKNPLGRLDAVYSSPARRAQSGTLGGSWNLFLDMFNFARIFNTGEDTETVELIVRNGSTETTRSIVLSPKRGRDLGLHEQTIFGTERNTYGSFTVSGDTLLVDLLRFRFSSSSGQLDFMFPTAVR